jgi:hypothetical protein
MIEITEDELTDLPITQVIGATTADDEDEEYDVDNGIDDEFQFGQDNAVVEADAQTLKLHAECQKVGGEFNRLCNVLDEHKPFIVSMMRQFDYKKGFRGHAIQFPDFTEPIFFPDYVEKVYGIKVHRLNQLINHTPENFVKHTPKPLEERPDYIKGVQAGRQTAEDQMAAKGVDIKSTVADIVGEKPPTAPPVIDSKDVYAYFSQLEKEPQTIAFEIVAMLEELGLDAQQIKAVSDLMKKQVKAATA